MAQRETLVVLTLAAKLFARVFVWGAVFLVGYFAGFYVSKGVANFLLLTIGSVPYINEFPLWLRQLLLENASFIGIVSGLLGLGYIFQRRKELI